MTTVPTTTVDPADDPKRYGACGASETAKLFNLSKWGNRLDLWKDKTGKRKKTPTTPEQRWGIMVEPAILALYAELSGLEMMPCPKWLSHPTYPHMGASLDGVARANPPIVVEAKSASDDVKHQWGEPGTSQFPNVYYIQVQQQMAVARERIDPRIDTAHVAVSIGGRLPLRYVAKFDQRFVTIIGEQIEEFWEKYVIPDIPPPPQVPAEVARYLAFEFARHGIKTLEKVKEAEEGGEDFDEAAELWHQNIVARTINEHREAEIKARLMMMFDGRQRLKLTNGQSISMSIIAGKETWDTAKLLAMLRERGVLESELILCKNVGDAYVQLYPPRAWYDEGKQALGLPTAAEKTAETKARKQKEASEAARDGGASGRLDLALPDSLESL